MPGARPPPGSSCGCGRWCRARPSSSTTSPAPFSPWSAGSPTRLSQLNRATQSQRQPGSSIKPFTYLAALREGLQPNTLVRDQQITLPPIGGSVYNARERDYWTPKNDEGYGGGVSTLRRGLENSKNLVTANLLDGGIDRDPTQSLARVCELTLDAKIYSQCVAYYPFVLGAQPARLIDMAAFYAAIANEGRRPSPYGIESIEQSGHPVYTHTPEFKWLGGGDRPSFFQLRTMLQGVVARGTARAIGQLSPYVGGKTGTSDDENDAWFVGFTNDVTIGVWVGYDKQGQAAHAWRRPDRRPGGGADLRADRPGDVVEVRRADAARSAVAGGQEGAGRPADRSRQRHPHHRPPPERLHRIVPGAPRRDRRHPVQHGLAIRSRDR